MYLKVILSIACTQSGRESCCCPGQSRFLKLVKEGAVFQVLDLTKYDEGKRVDAGFNDKQSLPTNIGFHE